MTFTTDEYAMLFALFIKGALTPDDWGDYTIAYGKYWLEQKTRSW